MSSQPASYIVSMGPMIAPAVRLCDAIAETFGDRVIYEPAVRRGFHGAQIVAFKLARADHDAVIAMAREHGADKVAQNLGIHAGGRQTLWSDDDADSDLR